MGVLLSTSNYAKLPFCDSQAGTAALEAHQKKYAICAETGCEVNDVKYLGRGKERVTLHGQQYLKVNSIKSYRVVITDEVDGDKWLVKADAGKNCEIKEVIRLGY